MYPFLPDPDPLFVEYSGHYSNACPIRRPSQSSMSCGNENSTVQGSSSHKCSQEVWWDALNVVTATIPLVMLELTPFSKLFLYRMTSYGNVSLTWSYYPRV